MIVVAETLTAPEVHSAAMMDTSDRVDDHRRVPEVIRIPSIRH
jgi:hypothetical protein